MHSEIHSEMFHKIKDEDSEQQDIIPEGIDKY